MTTRTQARRAHRHWLINWWRTSDVSLIAGKVAVWVAVLTFGGIFWAINGGFSVAGLEVIATSFNAGGKLFWAAISGWAFATPVAAEGLPSTQPVLPWLGVVAASLMQVVVLYRRFRGLIIPVWMVVAAVLLSAYDLCTTFFGLGLMAWIEGAGLLVQGLLALLLTFIVELTIGLLLRPTAPIRSENDDERL